MDGVFVACSFVFPQPFAKRHAGRDQIAERIFARFLLFQCDEMLTDVAIKPLTFTADAVAGEDSAEQKLPIFGEMVACQCFG